MGLKVDKTATTIKIIAQDYILEHDFAQNLFVSLIFNNGIGGRLFVASGCDRDEMIDELQYLDKPVLRQSDDRIDVIFAGKTTLWNRVEYCFSCYNTRVLYAYKVEGCGSLDDVRFFEGFIKDDPRLLAKFKPAYTGEGRKTAWHRPVKDFLTSSVPKFDIVFSTQINSADKRFYMYYEQITHRLNGWIYNYGGDCFVTPSIFSFMVGPRTKDKWVTMGLVVKPGENNFLNFDYCGGEGFGFNLNYSGKTFINGQWCSPAILFEKAGDVYDGLRSYVNYLINNGYVNKRNRSTMPLWWKKPIFGGWGEQCYHSTSWQDYFTVGRSGRSGQSAENCTQAKYEEMLDALEKKGVNPCILIVDNRWYKNDCCLEVDEQLWPDMKGFIQNQHVKGRKVILWVSPFHYQPSAMGKDVLPEELLILNDANSYKLEIDTDIFYPAMKMAKKKVRVPHNYEYGQHKWDFGVNPLSAAYENRVRRKVQYLLSTEGLDADGIEFDYLHNIPSRTGFVPNGGGPVIWGIELLRKTLALYYCAAKKAKPDSLVIAHTFNPYFNDVVDMLRLNDFYTDNKSVVDQMLHRAMIAAISCPGCCIHTDQHPMPNLEAWREYAKFQPFIGNPVLYYVTGMETTYEKFTDADYELLKSIWSKYLKSYDRVYAPLLYGNSQHEPDIKQLKKEIV
ncbi:MAG: hypothetical protein A2Y12_17055 [Planctomycetes bacterium GWF2_42_9]|nr:MAG: hypothetical protein A2Y12_17055 [Planctomycetes bacterium GWF2_42_9]